MPTSSSSSSSSSSSTGDIQSPIALLEMIEEAIEAVSLMQSYTLGDRRVTRAELDQLMEARKMLMGEVAQKQGKRPLVAKANFSSLMS